MYTHLNVGHFETAGVKNGKGGAVVRVFFFPTPKLSLSGCVF